MNQKHRPRLRRPLRRRRLAEHLAPPHESDAAPPLVLARQLHGHGGAVRHRHRGVGSLQLHGGARRHHHRGPGGNTVGGVGGWVGGGGHSVVSSTLGLGADQVLSLDVVTADGRYVTADPFTNPDLFFALRGGGGATYGIIISAVYKAHPPITLTTTSLSLTLSSASSPSIPTNGAIVVRNADAFWTGVGLYYRFCGRIIEGDGGQGFSYIYPQADGGFRFTTTSTFLNRSRDEVGRIMQPLYTSLRQAGVLTAADADPTTRNSSIYGASRRGGTGTSPSTRGKSDCLRESSCQLWPRSRTHL
ncbi:hypothetical protein PG997_003143 [Apiospora hydei]|uniref:FAD-binding PCMH-type domain-containing protein n=1 Tax=Apiospora hydei TaxID=1337664 RepID=A0ABR1WYF5_9PEZI